MKKTSQEITMQFMGHVITIPKGTRVTNQTALGIDPNYNFIDDLSWIPKEQAALRHDAYYHGINIPQEFVTGE